MTDHRGIASDRPLYFEVLEPRILLSADPVAAVGADVLHDHGQQDFHSIDLHHAGLALADTFDLAYSSAADNTIDLAELGAAFDVPMDEWQGLFNYLDTDRDAPLELVFVDPGVAETGELIQSLTANDDAHYLVFELDANTDGVEQVSAVLAGFDRVDAVHLVSHGDEGRALLGSSVLSNETLAGYSQLIEGWGDSLTDRADILFYGCDLAANQDGGVLLSALASLTGADVAASDDATGAAQLGGDWNLEVATGVIEAKTLSAPDWQYVLAPTEKSILFSTDASVTGVSGNTGSLSAWSDHEAIEAGRPGLAAEPGTSAATFRSWIDLSDFGSSAHIDAIDYVDTGVSSFAAGDLLLSVDSSTTLGSLSVTADDIILFSPTTAGDYSSGTFSMVLDDANNDGSNVTAIALAEKTVSFGGLTSVSAGDILFAVGDGRIRQAGDLLLVIPTITNFYDASGDFSAPITGLEIIDEATTIGSTSLSAGELLLTLGSSDTVSGVAVTPQDVVSVDINFPVLGSPSLDAASLVFEGADVAFDTAGANFDALTLRTLTDNPATGSVTIDGLASEDKVLSANTSTLADADGLGSFSYQWIRDSVDIAGANASTYTLGDADVDANISVAVSWIDGSGNAELVTSSEVGPIANLNDAPVGTVDISGTLTEDQTLAADTSGLSDADGLGAFSYQWQRNLV
ncbi:MAG: DUF4347 domain-containing protein, partial [Pseudomonadales bacterium]|nr:DUF4347 domain-containing protein [Pseudomonadales bacterium]